MAQALNWWHMGAGRYGLNMGGAWGVVCGMPMERSLTEHDEPSDAVLLARVSAGGSAGEHAFGVLYFRHRDFVLRVAMRITRDEGLAQDAAQEAFFGLLRRVSRRPLVLEGRLSTYLYPAVRRSALRAMKKRGRVAEGKTGETPAPLQEEIGGDDGERVAVLRAMGRLTEVQREVVVLHVVEGLTLAEVGRAMGCPEGTVKSRLHKALVLLRGDERLRGLFSGA